MEIDRYIDITLLQHGCYPTAYEVHAVLYNTMTRRGLQEIINIYMTGPDVTGVRCSSAVRAFVHGAMDRRIDPSWWTH